MLIKDLDHDSLEVVANACKDKLESLWSSTNHKTPMYHVIMKSANQNGGDSKILPRKLRSLYLQPITELLWCIMWPWSQPIRKQTVYNVTGVELNYSQSETHLERKWWWRISYSTRWNTILLFFLHPEWKCFVHRLNKTDRSNLCIFKCQLFCGFVYGTAN